MVYLDHAVFMEQRVGLKASFVTTAGGYSGAVEMTVDTMARDLHLLALRPDHTAITSRSIHYAAVLTLPD
eukprot:6190588-Pleurochrysis_carterae.AAC.1